MYAEQFTFKTDGTELAATDASNRSLCCYQQCSATKKLCMTAMLLFYILISRRTFYSSKIYRPSCEGFH
jgi:hypothetical protein